MRKHPRREEHGVPVGDSDLRDPSRTQPIDAAKLQLEDVEPGSPPRIAETAPPASPSAEPVTGSSRYAPRPGVGPATSEPTGAQPYLPPGRDPGERGGAAMRAAPSVRTDRPSARRAKSLGGLSGRAGPRPEGTVRTDATTAGQLRANREKPCCSREVALVSPVAPRPGRAQS